MEKVTSQQPKSQNLNQNPDHSQNSKQNSRQPAQFNFAQKFAEFVKTKTEGGSEKRDNWKEADNNNTSKRYKSSIENENMDDHPLSREEKLQRDEQTSYEEIYQCK